MLDPQTTSTVGNENSRRSILIADDDVNVRLLMYQALKDLGYELLLAEDGEEALALWREHRPALVVLDVSMPRRDGFSVCEEIRRTDPDGLVPILIVTNYGDDGAIGRAFELGASEFLVKPIRWPLLSQRVRYILRASEAFAAVKRQQQDLTRLADFATLRNQIYNIFLTRHDQEDYEALLPILLRLTNSREAIFGSIEPDGDLVCLARTDAVRRSDETPPPDPDNPMIPKQLWPQSWQEAVASQEAQCLNSPDQDPEGKLDRSLVVPIVHERKTIGLVAVADKAEVYQPHEIAMMEEICAYLGPVLEVKLANAVQEQERRAHLAAIRDSEERYRDLIDRSLDVVWRIDTVGRLTFVSPAIRSVLGYEPDDLIGEPFTKLAAAAALRDLDEAGVRERVHDLLHRLARDDIRFEMQFIHRDGSISMGETQMALLVDEDGNATGVQGFTRDVTARKRAESALKQSEAYWRAISEHSPNHVMLLDREAVVQFANRGARDTHGRNVVGNAFYDVLPSDQQTAARQAVASVLEDDDPASFVVQYATGQRERHYNVSLGPVTQSGEAVGVVASFADITEPTMMMKELQKVERLESLALLAGGIAHDLNNQLTAIVGNVSLSQIEDDPDARGQLLQETEHACFRIKELTEQLLTFARGGSPVIRTTDVRQLLTGSARFALRGSKVDSRFEIAADTWPVAIDEGQIHQVINNLVINARQAMTDGGVIEIGTENCGAAEPTSPALTPGNYVRVTIADEGPGIPEDVLPSIFEPFFTTKDEGTGLGLATTHAIIQKHGGDISVQSSETGTTFTLYLPAAPDQVPAAAPAHDDLPERFHGRILFMDDDRDIRHFAENMLQKIGYQVVICASGEEAVQLSAGAVAGGTPFDVAILDLTVPGAKGGKEVIDELRTMMPDLKAVISSGYSNDPIAASYRQQGFDGYIAKPYGLNELRGVLHRLQGGPVQGDAHE